MTSNPLSAVQKAEHLPTWDVHPRSFPFGLGRKLGQVEALDRASAEAAAKDAYPGHELLDVVLAGARPTRRPRFARDLGNTKPPRREKL